MQRSVTSLSSHLLSLFLPLTTALIFISSFLAPSHNTRQGTGHGSGHGSPTATTQPNPPPPPFRFSPSPTTKLLLVSSLDDTGPSTLRSCIESAGPRVCLFQVAGVIELNRQIKARFPDLLVAGETAPAPGITLVGAGLSIETSNVELRHLASRPAAPTTSRYNTSPSPGRSTRTSQRGTPLRATSPSATQSSPRAFTDPSTRRVPTAKA
jgi:hypothetical protein